MLNFLPWKKRSKDRVDYIRDEMEREKILEMLANSDDQSFISVLKKIYNISDRELAAKRNELFRKRINWKSG
jgi:hypothetical protein